MLRKRLEFYRGLPIPRWHDTFRFPPPPPTQKACSYPQFCFLTCYIVLKSLVIVQKPFKNLFFVVYRTYLVKSCTIHVLWVKVWCTGDYFEIWLIFGPKFVKNSSVYHEWLKRLNLAKLVSKIGNLVPIQLKHFGHIENEDSLVWSWVQNGREDKCILIILLWNWELK